jgi:hypothetical protein
MLSLAASVNLPGLLLFDIADFVMLFKYSPFSLTPSSLNYPTARETQLGSCSQLS